MMNLKRNLPNADDDVDLEEDQETEGQPLPTKGSLLAGDELPYPPRISAREKKRPAYLSQFE